jgi:DNA-binding NarL/FixJ family response regulator
MQTHRLSVLLVADHLAMRAGLEVILRDAGMRIAATASGVAEARSPLMRGRYDVALVDIRLGSESALGVVEETLAQHPSAAVVLYTGYKGTAELKAAMRSGARGIVLKSSPVDRLVDALRTVAAGGFSVDPGLAPLLVNRAETAAVSALSPREREIFGMLAEGLTGQAIAERLFLSPETVRTHVRNGTAKLGAKTRVQAVALMLKSAA